MLFLAKYMDNKWSIKHCGQLVEPSEQVKVSQLLQDIEESITIIFGRNSIELIPNPEDRINRKPKDGIFD